MSREQSSAFSRHACHNWHRCTVYSRQQVGHHRPTCHPRTCRQWSRGRCRDL